MAYAFKRKICAVSAVVCALLLAASCAAADVVLEAPSEVEIGQPFLVRAKVSGENLSEASIMWNGARAPLAPEQGGLAYSALLGTDLKNTEAGEMELAFVFRSGSGPEEKISHRIKLIKHDYPIEKLKVAPSKVSPPKEVSERIAREAKLGAAAMNTLTPGHAPRLPFIRPVPGIFTSVYGKSRYFNNEFRGRHGGVDMRAKHGTPVKAAADGTVVLTGDFWFAGKCIYIDHGAGLITFYCHLSDISVKRGESVNAGAQIGLSGSSGRVTGPHLHFSAAWRGQFFDPAPLLHE